MSDEQLNKIMAKADNDLEALKDRCHELYDENKILKKNNEKLIEIINSIPQNIINMVQNGSDDNE